MVTTGSDEPPRRSRNDLEAVKGSYFTKPPRWVRWIYVAVVTLYLYRAAFDADTGAERAWSVVMAGLFVVVGFLVGRPSVATTVDDFGVLVRRYVGFRHVGWREIDAVLPPRIPHDPVHVRLRSGSTLRLAGFPQEKADALAAVVRARSGEPV